MSFFETANVSWLQSLATGVRKLVTLGVPIVAVVQFVLWVIRDWWQSLIAQVIDQIDGVLNGFTVSIGFGEIDIPWSQVNSVIPLTELISLLILYQAFIVALIGVRWIRIVNPFMS